MFVETAQLLVNRLGADLHRHAGLSHADFEILVRLSEADGRQLRMSELAGRPCSPVAGSPTPWPASRSPAWSAASPAPATGAARSRCSPMAGPAVSTGRRVVMCRRRAATWSTSSPGRSSLNWAGSAAASAPASRPADLVSGDELVRRFVWDGARTGEADRLVVEDDCLVLDIWWPAAFRVAPDVFGVRGDEAPDDSPVIADLSAQLSARGFRQVATNPPLLHTITLSEIALGLVEWSVWATDGQRADAALAARAGHDSYLTDDPPT